MTDIQSLINQSKQSPPVPATVSTLPTPKLECPATYTSVSLALFKRIPASIVADRDVKFLTSLQQWQGTHSAKQQPHVLKLLQKYYPYVKQFHAPINIVKRKPDYAELPPVKTEQQTETPSVQENDARQLQTGTPINSSNEAPKPQQTEPAVNTSVMDLISANNKAVKLINEADNVIKYGTPNDAVKMVTKIQQFKNQVAEQPPVLQLEPAPELEDHLTWDDLDESQQSAINGMEIEQYSCLTGAAGTGKTTSLKMLMDKLRNSARSVDINSYHYSDLNKDSKKKEEHRIPAIALCAYTGRAVQQIRKNMPGTYHHGIMTIHKMLGFHPEFVEVEDKETGLYKEKLQFVPFYDAATKLPWDIIVIDEAGMMPIPLWHQVLEACKPHTRIIMVGDINQLPPVHGRPAFGYALTSWPSYELSKIHRQKGESNPIVDNAWRVLKGEFPEKVPGKFDMIRIPGTDSRVCEQALLQVVYKLHKDHGFDPMNDGIIVPQNGNDPDKTGYLLGQMPLNTKLSIHFNPSPPQNSEEVKGRKHFVQAGVMRKIFAIGDKVMVTQNDNDRGLTNGMVGEIVDITLNGKSGHKVESEMIDFSDHDFDKMMKDVELQNLDSINENRADKDEDYNSRASSHVITVNFGRNYDGKEIIEGFSTTGQVNSLTLAYAFTCHKSQGGEYPIVIICVHSSNHRMLYREWLYTAITRAQHRVVLIYNDRGLGQAINRQKIKGRNLQEKAQCFLDWAGRAPDKSPELPEPKRLHDGRI